MTGSAAARRAWRGPALFAYGFRPFFLGAACWAALAMALWLATIAGHLALPSAFDPVAWHAHEFLFGYVGAAIAGFLLTAVPNWTGRLPIHGWPLAGLAALWLAGRIAVAVSLHMPPSLVAAVDLALPLALGAAMAREIVAGRNWRNLPVLALLAVFALANGLFHAEAMQGLPAAQGHGLRLGLAATMTMIALIGGRIVPSFTRNWLARRGPGRLPAPPMAVFDRLAMLALLVALALWVGAPDAAPTAIALAIAAALHALRLGRWAGERTWAAPLLWILHAGYAFLPLGAALLALAILAPEQVSAAAAQHAWMAGAAGTMTLAVMTRATRGHTGRALVADAGTTALYILLIVAVLARLAAGLWPAQAAMLHAVAGFGWIAAFAGFVAIYGPMLWRLSAGTGARSP